MVKIIVYHKPTCSTSRKAVKALTEKELDFEIVKYYETPFTKALLNDLLKKMKMKPSELMRKKDKIYKELDIKNKNYTEAQILNLMLKYPDLIERPIVRKGAKVILARPPERINDLI
ncbi:MAG: arsenate reductase (glutaredoxin) [Bacteroidetes bacterium]|nr:arsenate reductase (glutaredoxin) [Bacteroidota bacterium]MCH7772585.1 arsenate reductase (glutaredoxin) [Bacteroidota bacterium]